MDVWRFDLTLRRVWIRGNQRNMQREVSRQALFTRERTRGKTHPSLLFCRTLQRRRRKTFEIGMRFFFFLQSSHWHMFRPSLWFNSSFLCASWAFIICLLDARTSESSSRWLVQKRTGTKRQIKVRKQSILGISSVCFTTLGPSTQPLKITLLQYHANWFSIMIVSTCFSLRPSDVKLWFCCNGPARPPPCVSGMVKQISNTLLWVSSWMNLVIYILWLVIKLDYWGAFLRLYLNRDDRKRGRTSTATWKQDVQGGLWSAP